MIVNTLSSEISILDCESMKANMALSVSVTPLPSGGGCSNSVLVVTIGSILLKDVVSRDNLLPLLYSSTLLSIFLTYVAVSTKLTSEIANSLLLTSKEFNAFRLFLITSSCSNFVT